MDLDGVTLDEEDAAMADLVESIYQDKANYLLAGGGEPGMPDSPPDSTNTDQILMSPGTSSASSPPHSNNQQLLLVQQQQQPMTQLQLGQQQQHQLTFPDLSSIDYSVPMSIIEGGIGDFEAAERQQQKPGEASESAITVSRTKRKRKEAAPAAPSSQLASETPTVIKQEHEGHSTVRVKLEPTEEYLQQQHVLALQQPQQFLPQQQVPSNIRFGDFQQDSWHKTFAKNLLELPVLRLSVTADKGFVFSPVDNAFIAQKKNHFQLTCHIQTHNVEEVPISEHHYVRLTPPSSSSKSSSSPPPPSSTSLAGIAHLQVNFYGVKLDSPESRIRVEQSQADRSKVRFDPVRLPGNGDEQQEQQQPVRVCAGRLHFTETTANNMRKKGRPNPAQKYFQLVVSLEAVVHPGTPHQRELPVARAASERIIVRASNPGQFEGPPAGAVPIPVAVTTTALPPGIETVSATVDAKHSSAAEAGCIWRRGDGGDGDTAVYHMGKVGINTDQVPESLTVHGNVQLTGQLLQPSDLRVKERIREVDPRKQLENVNAMRIVEFKYKKEYVEKLPRDLQQRLEGTPQTGVIAQEVQRVLPDAVSSTALSAATGKTVPPAASPRSGGRMLVVDKDRIFLENVGAVRELSRVTGALESRIGDLEKATETVEVKLARMRRGGGGGNHHHRRGSHSTTSSCSSTFSRARLRAMAPGLLQRKWAQAMLFVLIAVAALSITCMAGVYVVGNINRNKTGLEGIEEKGGQQSFSSNRTVKEATSPLPSPTYEGKASSPLVPSPNSFADTSSPKETLSSSDITTATTSAETAETAETSAAEAEAEAAEVEAEAEAAEATTTTTLSSSMTMITTPTKTPPVVGEGAECPTSGDRSGLFTTSSGHDRTSPPGHEDTVNPESGESIVKPQILFSYQKLDPNRGTRISRGGAGEPHQTSAEGTENHQKGDEVLAEYDDDQDKNSADVEEQSRSSSKTSLYLNEVLPKPEEKETVGSVAGKAYEKEEVNQEFLSNATSAEERLEEDDSITNELQDPMRRTVRKLKQEREELNQVGDEKADDEEEEEEEEEEESKVKEGLDFKEERKVQTGSTNDSLVQIPDEEKGLNEVMHDKVDGEEDGDKDHLPLGGDVFEDEDTTENVVEHKQVELGVERAKRAVPESADLLVARLLRKIVRKIRNADEAADSDEDNSAEEQQLSQEPEPVSSRFVAPILVTNSSGNFTLNSTFCDRDHPCHSPAPDVFDSSPGGNVSLRVQLSRCFSEPYVRLEFPVLSGAPHLEVCNTTHQPDRGDCGVADGGDLFENGQTEASEVNYVDLRVNGMKSSAFRIRLGIPDPSQDDHQEHEEDSLCQKPDSEAGEAYWEYNIVFYRNCPL